MSYKYYTCDVFTSERFGGNQLAVLPDAQGLNTEQMQNIAREFNYSETTFVFPPEQGHTRRVRIFTPSIEVPFAGHPNLGTAFILLATGELKLAGESDRIVFEEDAGLVSITVRGKDPDPPFLELRAPKSLEIGPTIPEELLAEALSLSLDDLLLDTHPPGVISVGLPFVCVELRNLPALAEVALNMAGFARIEERGITPDIIAYVRSEDAFDIRSRVFAPFDGVAEDPATGSANCALAGLLAHRNASPSGTFTWNIGQGIEMGRASHLTARALKSDGTVTDTWIGGHCVMVAQGVINVDQSTEAIPAAGPSARPSAGDSR